MKHSGKDGVLLVIVKGLGFLTLLLTGNMFRVWEWNILYFPLASAEDAISLYVQGSALRFSQTGSHFQLYSSLPA